MKREEALRIIKECKERGFKHTFYTLNEYHTALDIAIKALEQEPCEDAISHEDALMALTGEWTESTDELIHRFIRRIKNLPPVNPQPKTGHWIKKEDDTCWWYVCSECEQEPLKNRWNDDDVLSTFCHNCGAKMIEPQESEVQE